MNLDMSGKTVVITGANSGLGKASTRALARRGARIIMVCRSPERGQEALEALRKDAPGQDISLIVGDLGRPEEVKTVAEAILQAAPRIDVLLNNAGVYQNERVETSDGLEATFAINHLGYYLLTEALIHRLADSSPSRIVNIASEAHRYHGLDLGDLQWEHRPYSGIKVYGTSKLLNILFTISLSRRLLGSGVTVNAVHPGGVATNLFRSLPKWLKPLETMASLIMRDPEVGAKTQIWAASSKELEGVTGRYFANCKERTPSKDARKESLQGGAWAATEVLAGHPFPTAPYGEHDRSES